MDRQVRHSSTEHFARRLDTQTGLIESICLGCYCTVYRSEDIVTIERQESQHDCPMAHGPESSRAENLHNPD